MEKLKNLKLPKLKKMKKSKKKVRKKEKNKINKLELKDNHLIAIWGGSPGSGKTTLAVKTAKELAEKKKNVIILHDDVFVQLYQFYCQI